MGPLQQLDPLLNDGPMTLVQDLVYEPLVRAGGDGAPVPALASAFVRDSARVVRVQLRSDATFSDGSAVTADEVMHSLAREGISVSREQNWIRIEGAKLLPDAELMSLFVWKNDARGRQIGSGPFERIDETPTQLTLRRRTPAARRIFEVVLSGYPTARDAFARTLSGEANLLPVADPKQLEFFNGVDRLKIVRSRALSAVGVAMSMTRLDRATRRSVVELVPRAQIAQLVFEDSCPPYPRIDPRRAEQPISRKLDVFAGAVEPWGERMALALSRSLGSAGGAVRVGSVKDYAALLASGDFDLVVRRAVVWPVSAIALDWHSQSPFNYTHYSNPRVDAAIEVGDWPRAMQELAQDPPIDFICTPERLAVVDARVKNPQLGPYGLLETLPDWEVAP